MLKMVMIVYNEALDVEMKEVLEHCGVKNYTKVTGVLGRGTHSGMHEGNDIWPGRNNILYVACAENQVKQILVYIKDFRKKLSHEGIKAFALPIEEMT